jgi:pimeloyl-ACP methyl ester carboxylesterase
MKLRSLILVYFLFLISFLNFSITLKSQDITNKYLFGNIETGNISLEVAFSISLESEKFETKMYVPEQFIYAMEAESYYHNDSLKLNVNKLKAEFNGVWIDSINSYQGTWHQGQQYYPTVLKSVEKKEVLFIERPQTPQPPFSYIEKEICVDNTKAASVLCGTLTLPDEDNDYPLVILITGSGAQDRNEEIAGHQPFKVIADHLTKCGYAVFRYDDRGYAKSKGDLGNSTSYDFMTDAAAIVKFFGDYPNINSDNIGIIGHSEGAMIAMMLAAKYPKDIAYIISLAGPAISISKLMLKQTEDINRAAGIAEEDIQWISKMTDKAFDIALKSKNQTEMRKGIVKLYQEYSEDRSPEQIEEFGLNQAGINRAVMQMSSEWMKYFIAFEPSKYLKKIKCPVLALNGTKDIQVNYIQNIEGFKSSINHKKCPLLEVNVIENLNHLFQHAETGTVQEYYYITETFSPLALEIIEEFIKKQ